MEIRENIVTGEACLKVKPLWEEVFEEDQGAFADYYFKTKTKNNLLLVLEACNEAKSTVVSMLHLTPYPMMIRVGSEFVCTEINYIVGVATKQEYRHRGYMKRLLEKAFSVMSGEKQPFVFLMPADPKIYSPFDFVYIYDRPEYEWNKPAALKAAQESVYQIAPLNREDWVEFIDFVNCKLKSRYQIFTRRDQAYYEQQVRELEVLNGDIYLIKKDRLCGYYLASMEERPFVQEAWLPEGEVSNLPFKKKEQVKPMIMGRIVDVKAMLSLLRTKMDRVSLTFRINDSWIKENHGIFTCIFEPDTARVSSGQTQPVVEAGIDQLALWVFGRKEPEDCFDFPDENREKDTVIREMKKIIVLDKVYINEIV